MAATDRGSAAGLRTWLDAARHRLRFFQAVRLLQRAHPERTPVGVGDDPRREAVRLRSAISLAFPPSEVAELHAGDDDRPGTLSAAFLGLANPHSFGSLPMPYTEALLAQRRDGAPAFDDFLALFDHRLLSLFYRAWEVQRFAISFERLPAGGIGRFENAVLCLIGLGTPAQRGRLPVEDIELIARADVLARPGATARGLAGLVEAHFGAPVTVRSFVPGWYELEEAERSRLGRSACSLGRDLVLGARVQLAQSRFRLRVGPLSQALFRELLPGEHGAAALASLVRLAAGPEYDFECQLVLRREDVPPLRLSAEAASERPRLGWTTWLHALPLARDPEDVVIVHDQGAAAAPLPSEGMRS
jgi:type VI secretion system protein ImpH